MSLNKADIRDKTTLVLSVIIALLIATLYLGTIGYFAFKFHTIGDWGVESDFYWDYAPAAKDLLNGKMNIGHYKFRGPGYPLLLVPFIAFVNDSFFAAQILALICSFVCLILIFSLFQKYFNPLWGTWAVLALVLNGTFERYSFRAGTDIPFLMMCLAFYLIITSKFRGKALTIGLLAGFAFLTRYNGISLVIVCIIWAAYYNRGIDKGEYLRKLIFVSCGILVMIIPWSVFLHLQTGDPFYNLNYQNISYELSKDSVKNWDQFWYSDSSSNINSMLEVIRAHKWKLAALFGTNLIKHFPLDLSKLMGLMVGFSVIGGIVLTIFNKTNFRYLRAIIASGIAIYIVLCPVFYSARFSLPLLPVYLIFSCLFFTSEVVINFLAKYKINQKSILIIAYVVILWGSPSRINYLINEMKIVPNEILTLTDDVAFNSLPKGKMAARKPHAAYYLEQEFVVLPSFKSINLVTKWMVENDIDYLFLSFRESSLRPELAGLLTYPNGHPSLELLAIKENDNTCGIWRLVKQ